MQSTVSYISGPPTTPIGQRLKQEMKKRGISSAELAKRADVKTSFIYDVISGKSANPSTVKLARVAESLDISLGYLVGNGDHAALPNDAYVSIPRVTLEVPSGGTNLTEHEVEYYHFRASWIKDHLKSTPSDLRLLYIRGDGMAPTLCHNDIVLVDTGRKVPTPPGIFIIFDGHGLLSKRLEYSGDHRKVRILSDNPKYSTYERSAADTFIIGRVVWFAREM